jgi:hypothetical protein
LQYANTSDGRLMMLPTDLCLKHDPGFAPIAQEYANDQAAFFKDFRLAYGKLMALGCPNEAWPEELKAFAPGGASAGSGPAAPSAASSSLRAAVRALRVDTRRIVLLVLRCVFAHANTQT